MLSKSAEETKTYFKQQVQPIFEQLIAEIAFNRPENIEEYAIRYFKNPKKMDRDQSDSEDDCDRFEEITQEQFNIQKTMKLQNAARKRRKGVRSQINNYFSNLRQPISLRSAGHKDQKTQTMIRFYFMNSFLFQDFEESDKQFLINSMISHKTKTDQIILREGEYGDCMYFVQSGLFQCSILEKDAKNTKREVKVLRNYQTGDYFGQLCLLHSAKRQATIVSKTQGQLYSLSRDVYNHIRRTSIAIRRQLYIKNLKKVNIFESLTEQDFEKLCDLLHEVRYEPNEYVIHEGDMGTKFYIVIEGLLASKGSKQQSFYQYYKQGDYFGELALIKKKPRQVSVLAITQCRLVSLSSQVFLSIIDMEKANNEINSKYKGSKPLPVSRRKRMPVDQSFN